MLNKIKVLLGIKDASKDKLLNVLLEGAIKEAQNITHNDNITDLENVICNMVIYQFNRLGTEGVESENYSGVSYDYSTDYPEAIMRQIRAKRKVVVI